MSIVSSGQHCRADTRSMANADTGACDTDEGSPSTKKPKLDVEESGQDESNRGEDLMTKSESGACDDGMLKETDVGITQYINDLPGFHGVIKQRYRLLC